MHLFNTPIHVPDPRSMHQQVTKCLKIRKAYNCLENTHFITYSVHTKGRLYTIMGPNILRHASLDLYNHFNTHEAEYHDTIVNHCSDILPLSICTADPYCVCVSVPEFISCHKHNRPSLWLGSCCIARCSIITKI